MTDQQCLALIAGQIYAGRIAASGNPTRAVNRDMEDALAEAITIFDGAHPDTEREKALFAFLKHGDAGHQAWLKSALFAFFRGMPRPEMP